MARIILVTGGSRSGKSAYAQKLAESLPGPRAYVATCPDIDNEIHQRIHKHREARQHTDWHTIEETLNLADVVNHGQGYNVLLVECVTLWINNLMYEAEKAGREIAEEDVGRRSGEILAACRAFEGTVIFVTNEVGMGIVPENALCRRYRDLVGRCNQVLAADADVVTLVTCGIPLDIKERRVDV
ncbi:MAG: bifunctional adenosylcobinamide kinase/adenosylcobinamide-phosphate guanylyltransferase [Phycisphaerae bacterium]